MRLEQKHRRISFWIAVAGVSAVTQYGLEALAMKPPKFLPPSIKAGFLRFVAYSHGNTTPSPAQAPAPAKAAPAKTAA